jgi:hypothetical protein
MLALAMETLWRLGAKEPRAHLILLQQSSVATLLVSPSPFTPADLDRMQKRGGAPRVQHGADAAATAGAAAAAGADRAAGLGVAVGVRVARRRWT